jgi:hypothetical protein
MRLRYWIYGVFLILLGTAHDLLLGDHTSTRAYITLFAMGYLIAVADDIAAIADEVRKKASVRPLLIRGGRATREVGAALDHQEGILSETRRFGASEPEVVPLHRA